MSNNLFNEMDLGKLFEKLEFTCALTNEKKDFYFCNTSLRNWPELSFQARSVTLTTDKPLFDLFNYYRLSPKYMALSDFTMNAMPEGYVRLLENGEYEICVNKMYYFVNDIFNFENEDFLGAWDVNPRFEKPTLIVPYMNKYQTMLKV